MLLRLGKTPRGKRKGRKVIKERKEMRVKRRGRPETLKARKVPEKPVKRRVARSRRKA